MKIRFLSYILLIFFSNFLVGQTTIKINNPSFEDVPRKGTTPHFGIRGWMDCGEILFPTESPPDIHALGGYFWNVNLPASDGSTFLGLVVRDNDSYEGLSQRLSTPIEAEKCYTFNIDLARSPKYISQSRMTLTETNYITPTVLRVWGGTGLCHEKELLAESTPITHQEWHTYEFKIKSKFTLNYIFIEAYYKTPVFLPYCGHLLLDNLSDIEEVPCDEQQQEEIVALVPTKPKQKSLPPHKAGRVEKAKTQTTTVVKPPQKKKLLSDLDIKKIKQGTTVEIKNLYFAADSAKININSYDVLDEIYEFLNENPKIIVEIGGHTNGQPPHKYCDSLSTIRAKAVYDYLIKKGINSNKISYKGYGKRRRIAADNTKEGRLKNQRVEIKILSLG